MSAFLYYFPEHGSTKSQLTREDVRKTWVAESLWDVMRTPARWGHNTVTQVMYHGGPDKKVGTILACTQENEEILDFKLGYYPDRQQWVKVDEFAWLGWYSDSMLRPNPVALRRLWPVKGEMIELCDGQEWEAPIIRETPRRSIDALRLPKTFALDGSDNVQSEIKPEFAEFGNLADRIWDSYWHVDGREMTDVEIIKASIKLLNLNYRVSRPEINALKLLDSDSVVQIFRISNNFRIIEELLAENEKKDSPQKPSEQSPGDVDSSPKKSRLAKSTQPSA